MIPKVIHYCWFGGAPLPELAKKCIASWKKYCPDYEIKQWNETNFDVNFCDFAKGDDRILFTGFVQGQVLQEQGLNGMGLRRVCIAISWLCS